MEQFFTFAFNMTSGARYHLKMVFMSSLRPVIGQLSETYFQFQKTLMLAIIVISFVFSHIVLLNIIEVKTSWS